MWEDRHLYFTVSPHGHSPLLSLSQVFCHISEREADNTEVRDFGSKSTTLKIGNREPNQETVNQENGSYHLSPLINVVAPETVGVAIFYSFVLVPCQLFSTEFISESCL